MNFSITILIGLQGGRKKQNATSSWITFISITSDFGMYFYGYNNLLLTFACLSDTIQSFGTLVVAQGLKNLLYCSYIMAMVISISHRCAVSKQIIGRYY